MHKESFRYTFERRIIMEIKAYILLFLAVLAAGTGAYFYGNAHWWNDTPAPTTPQAQTPDTQTVIIQNNNGQAQPTTTVTTAKAVPIEVLAGSCKDKFTMAAVTTGNLSFYTPGADVKDPYITRLDGLDCGGNTSNLLIQTNTQYDVYYDGSGATYYDGALSGWGVNYNPKTGKGTLISNNVAYAALSPVGGFATQLAASLPEVQTGLNTTGKQSDSNTFTGSNSTATLSGDTDPDTTGTITCSAATIYNGSTTVAAGNYTLSGTGDCYITLDGDDRYNGATLTANYTMATDNLLLYDESAIAGSAWWKSDIGNNNANSELKDVVMCFRDSDGDMEGNEITSFTASYVSGTTAIAIPGSLQTYWEDAMGGAGAQCFTIATTLGSSQKARWQFQITAAEANWDTTEEFQITFEDLGSYLNKQYPSRNAKASPVTLQIGNMA